MHVCIIQVIHIVLLLIVTLFPWTRNCLLLLLCFSGQETACICFTYYTALYFQFQPDTTLYLFIITLLQEQCSLHGITYGIIGNKVTSLSQMLNYIT